MIDEEREAGNYDQVSHLQGDFVYTRARADVKINQTVLKERMHPVMLNSIDDVVTYHWNKRKQ
jgi:hypothetical protein